MTANRERVLKDIQTALGRREASQTQRDQLRQRIARHQRHIEPQFDEPPAQRFRQKLEAAEASFASVDSLDGAAAEVATYLDRHKLEKRLVVSGDELLRQVDWPDAFDLQRRVAQADDRVSLTGAVCGIAETGTLMLTSGENSPTSLNFLPDYHIVLLTMEQILPRMEDAWDRLRKIHEQMPRTVNFISGPSKTADVEQTVEYGAHGPRCLHVVLVE